MPYNIIFSGLPVLWTVHDDPHSAQSYLQLLCFTENWWVQADQTTEWRRSLIWFTETRSSPVTRLGTPLLALLGLYPQYRAIRCVLLGLTGNPDWRWYDEVNRRAIYIIGTADCFWVNNRISKDVEKRAFAMTTALRLTYVRAEGRVDLLLLFYHLAVFKSQ